MKKLLRVSVSVIAEYNTTTKVFNIEKETDLTYRCENRIINKSRNILKIDSVTHNNIANNTPSISFYTWCLPKDEGKAIELLKGAIRNKIMELEEGLKDLQKRFALPITKTIREY